MLDILKDKKYAIVDFEAMYIPETVPIDMHGTMCLVIRTNNYCQVFMPDSNRTEIETLKLFFSTLDKMELDYVIINTLSIFIEYLKQRIIENNIKITDILVNCQSPELKYYSVFKRNFMMPHNYKYSVKLNDNYKVLSFLSLIDLTKLNIVVPTLTNISKTVLDKTISDYSDHSAVILKENKCDLDVNSERYKRINYTISSSSVTYDVLTELINRHENKLNEKSLLEHNLKIKEMI